MNTDGSGAGIRAGPRVVVVGPCASGKTTLVDSLQLAGVDAHVSAQEHSAVRDLWRRLDPDVLIALDIDLPTLRSRRSPTWPAALHHTQRARLASAFESAQVRIDTSRLSASEVLAAVMTVIERYRVNSG